MATKKNAPKGKESKEKVSAAEVEAKKKARREAAKERAKNRPEGQRPNSRQVDIIEVGNGKVMVFGHNIRKFGVLATAVVLDKNDNPVSTSLAVIPGVKTKAKKGHGTFQPGVAGLGKKGKNAEAADEVEDDEDEEDED